MVLKIGDTNKNVLVWQKFLVSQGYDVMMDGIFGSRTESVTRTWQKANGIESDGKVGSESAEVASRLKGSALGFETVPVPAPKKSEYKPPRPPFSAPSGITREKMFGSFEYKKINSSEIRILGTWVQENIVAIEIPQLAGVEGASKQGKVLFHKKAAAQLKAVFDVIEELGLADRVISFAGTFYPRFVRGSSKSLSNHSFGSAIDINAPQNWLNQQPAAVGKKGSLLELVPIFNAFGFYWGGHYTRRLDGMHFEVAQLLSESEIEQIKSSFMPEEVEPADTGVSFDFHDAELETDDDLLELENKPEEAGNGSLGGIFSSLDEIIDLPEVLGGQNEENEVEKRHHFPTDRIFEKLPDSIEGTVKDMVDGQLSKFEDKLKDEAMKKLPDFLPKNFPAFIPQISWKKLLGLVVTPVFGFVSTGASYAAGLPNWLVFIFGVITGAGVVMAYFYYIKFDTAKIGYITEMNKALADPTKDNPILTTNPAQKGLALMEQIFDGQNKQ